MANTSPEDPKSTGARAPHEPLFIQYVSAVTGHVYSDTMVDHLADMLLIMYCGGGTALGAVTGASSAMRFFVNHSSTAFVIMAILVAGLVGSISGCLLVMAVLNLRGVLKWDGYILRRTIRLKR